MLSVVFKSDVLRMDQNLHTSTNEMSPSESVGQLCILPVCRNKFLKNL